MFTFNSYKTKSLKIQSWINTSKSSKRYELRMIISKFKRWIWNMLITSSYEIHIISCTVKILLFIPFWHLSKWILFNSKCMLDDYLMNVIIQTYNISNTLLFTSKPIFYKINMKNTKMGHRFQLYSTMFVYFLQFSATIFIMHKKFEK